MGAVTCERESLTVVCVLDENLLMHTLTSDDELTRQYGITRRAGQRFSLCWLFGRARPALAAAMIGIISGVAASMAMNMPTMTAV